MQAVKPAKLSEVGPRRNAIRARVEKMQQALRWAPNDQKCRPETKLCQAEPSNLVCVATLAHEKRSTTREPPSSVIEQHYGPHR